jgi:putative phosphoesterase
MKIAVLSDTHNNQEYTNRALEAIRAEGVSTIIHCGDISEAETVGLFNGFSVSFALGNADRNYGELKRAAESLVPSAAVAPFFTLSYDGIDVAVCHGHTETLRRLISSGSYGYVFHGHSHRRKEERLDDTVVVNPGALGGLRAQTRSFCFVDFGVKRVGFVEL